MVTGSPTFVSMKMSKGSTTSLRFCLRQRFVVMPTAVLDYDISQDNEDNKKTCFVQK